LVVFLVLATSPVFVQAQDAALPVASGPRTPIVTQDGYAIAVFRGETQIATLTLDDLKVLPQKELSTPDGKTQHGPTLRSVLTKAGVAGFKEVTVDGFSKGRLATAQLTLTSVQVHEEVLLDLTKRGTAKLTAADIPAGDWIIDVAKVSVK
jgi:hypothetical protein